MMNFFKWSLYLLALVAFIWVVFFRPLDASIEANELATTEETVPEEAVTDYQPVSTIEDIETIEEDITDAETVPEGLDTDQMTEDPPASDGIINLNSKYLIVVGSFGVKANADRMLKHVQNNGIDATLTLIRGLNRVVIASTNSEVEAEQLLDQFTHTFNEPAFILEQ